jgi:hypothetical protein
MELQFLFAETRSFLSAAGWRAHNRTNDFVTLLRDAPFELRIKPERRCTPTYRQYTHDHLNFLC